MIGTLNDLVERVEASAGEDLDVAAFAREHGTTEYHLRRMFSALAHMSLSEYVRRRRMTAAGAELAAGAPSLLDVAVRHGYGSVEAFGRAFRAVHGVTPSDARRDGGPLRTQPTLRLRLSVEGSTPMHVTITHQPSLVLAGHAVEVPLIHTGVNPHIQQHIAAITPEEHARLKALSDADPAGILAVTADIDPDAPEGSMLTYLHRCRAAGVDTGAGRPRRDTARRRRLGGVRGRRTVPRHTADAVGGDRDRLVPVEPVAAAARSLDRALPLVHGHARIVRALAAHRRRVIT